MYINNIYIYITKLNKYIYLCHFSLKKYQKPIKYFQTLSFVHTITSMVKKNLLLKVASQTLENSFSKCLVVMLLEV